MSKNAEIEYTVYVCALEKPADCNLKNTILISKAIYKKVKDKNLQEILIDGKLILCSYSAGNCSYRYLIDIDQSALLDKLFIKNKRQKGVK